MHSLCPCNPRCVSVSWVHCWIITLKRQREKRTGPRKIRHPDVQREVRGERESEDVGWLPVKPPACVPPQGVLSTVGLHKTRTHESVFKNVLISCAAASWQKSTRAAVCVWVVKSHTKGRRKLTLRAAAASAASPGVCLEMLTNLLPTWRQLSVCVCCCSLDLHPECVHEFNAYSDFIHIHKKWACTHWGGYVSRCRSFNLCWLHPVLLFVSYKPL